MRKNGTGACVQQQQQSRRRGAGNCCCSRSGAAAATHQPTTRRPTVRAIARSLRRVCARDLYLYIFVTSRCFRDPCVFLSHSGVRFGRIFDFKVPALQSAVLILHTHARIHKYSRMREADKGRERRERVARM